MRDRAPQRSGDDVASFPGQRRRGSSRSRRSSRRRRRRSARRSRARASSARRSRSAAPTSRRTARRSASTSCGSTSTASGSHHELVVVGAVALARRVRAYGSSSKPASSKPIENVLTGRVDCLGHQRDDVARIDAAAEERAERHVADAAACRTASRSRSQRAPRRLARSSSVELRAAAAAASSARRATPSARSTSEVVRRRQLADAREVPSSGSARTGRTGSASIAARSSRGRDARIGRSSALISEPNTSRVAVARVEERLLAEPVAREQQTPLRASQSAKREHAAQPRDAVDAALLVERGRSPRCRVRCGSDGRAPRARRAARGSCRSRR